MNKNKILRAGSYAYNPYKFVRFEVNGIECRLPESLEIEDRFALEEEQLGDMREAKEVIACLMKKS